MAEDGGVNSKGFTGDRQSACHLAYAILWPIVEELMYNNGIHPACSTRLKRTNTETSSVPSPLAFSVDKDPGSSADATASRKRKSLLPPVDWQQTTHVQLITRKKFGQKSVEKARMNSLNFVGSASSKARPRCERDALEGLMRTNAQIDSSLATIAALSRVCLNKKEPLTRLAHRAKLQFTWGELALVYDIQLPYNVGRKRLYAFATEHAHENAVADGEFGLAISSLILHIRDLENMSVKFKTVYLPYLEPHEWDNGIALLTSQDSALARKDVDDFDRFLHLLFIGILETGDEAVTQFIVKEIIKGTTVSVIAPMSLNSDRVSELEDDSSAESSSDSYQSDEDEDTELNVLPSIGVATELAEHNSVAVDVDPNGRAAESEQARHLAEQAAAIASAASAEDGKDVVFDDLTSSPMHSPAQSPAKATQKRSLVQKDKPENTSKKAKKDGSDGTDESALALKANTGTKAAPSE
ncbi:hypothetical protein HK105_208558 [Polyrhizophydium stewartii]|uniref:Uncharacterized protein n=1 Tax=Polyrhizophydium stewartii TaxID=2732419 RepID=A0ABR4MXE9_9FUNG